ncbi:hypothetical protein ACFPRL_27205 [Pseudoclavibacter helvolus]
MRGCQRSGGCRDELPEVLAHFRRVAGGLHRGRVDRDLVPLLVGEGGFDGRIGLQDVRALDQVIEPGRLPERVGETGCNFLAQPAWQVVNVLSVLARVVSTHARIVDPKGGSSAASLWKSGLATEGIHGVLLRDGHVQRLVRGRSDGEEVGAAHASGADERRHPRHGRSRRVRPTAAG